MKGSLCAFTVFFFLWTASYGQQQSDLYFPPINSGDWEKIDPSSLNWCPESIDSLYAILEEESTKSFLLLKDGKIVLEKYFGTYTQDSVWAWFSAGKSLTAVLIGIAQSEGLLNIQDRSSEYLGTGWTSLESAKEDSIRIWHQITMTGGMDERIFTCKDPACLIYITDAGTRWAYHNGPYSLLRNVIEAASGMGFNSFTNRNLGAKIGMEGFWLKSGDNNFYISNARTMARFGILVQSGGKWQEEQIVTDTAYFNAMTRTSQSLNPAYGYLWWLNGKANYIPPNNANLTINGPIAPYAPDDLFTAAGAQGQYISISPSSGLVMVRQGLSGENDLAALGKFDNIWRGISQLGCTTTSTLFDEDRSATISIYPNPVHSFLEIDTKDHQLIGLPFQLRMSNGTMVKSGMVPESLKINIADLPTGVYVLQVVLPNQIWTSKVMKL